MNLEVLGFDARQGYAANVFLCFFVHVGLDGRGEFERFLDARQCLPFIPGPSSEDAIEHFVEFTTKTKQLAIWISHTTLLFAKLQYVKRSPNLRQRRAEVSGSMAGAHRDP